MPAIIRAKVVRHLDVIILLYCDPCNRIKGIGGEPLKILAKELLTGRVKASWTGRKVFPLPVKVLERGAGRAGGPVELDLWHGKTKLLHCDVICPVL